MTHQLTTDGVLGKSPALSFFAEGITARRRLFVGDGFAYLASYPGYDVVDIRNPLSMVITGQAVDRGPNSFKQIVLDGGGFGVAAVGVNPGERATHDVYLYDTSNPAVTTSFLTVLPTPGVTHAVALQKGLAYAADGANGLQVINYRAADTGSKAPTISLVASFPLQPAQAEERRPSFVTAQVSDDAAVRSVEFFIDGIRVVDDGSFPFEARFTTPVRTTAKTSFTLQARATDTGGNSTLTPLITVALVPDATPPALLTTTPANGVVLPDIAYQLVARFDEPLGVSPTANWFQVIEAGADGQFDTADDAPISGLVRLVSANELALDFGASPLANGSYRAILRTAVTDKAGNPLASESKWQFTVADRGAPRIVTTSPPNGDLNVPASISEILVTISEPVRVTSVSEQSLSLTGGGPDGTVGNLNDRTFAAQKFEVLNGGTLLRFVFSQPFVPDVYRAVLSSNVTDLAGNRVSGSLVWDFTVPLRTTLRGRAVFADNSPAPGATVRRHNHGVAIGQTGAGGEFHFEKVEFEPYARPDLNVHLISGNRAFLGRALKVQPVPDGITELGTIVLEELCAPQLQDHLAGTSVLLARVSAFAEFNDGTGSALFALGNTSFDPSAAGLFRHDGRDWRRIEGKFEDESDLVQLVSLAVYDDGRGPALYVGGTFKSVGGVAATNIARWNSQKWEAVGTGLRAKQPGGPPYRVAAMTVFDDGTGPGLYAAGRFDFSGDVPAANIARWNGQNWTALDGGITSSFPSQNQFNDPESAVVSAMTAFNDGNGPALYLGGDFDFLQAGGETINATNIVRWKGGKWSALANGAPGFVNTLASFDDGSGPALFAGGDFEMPGNTPIRKLAKWNGTSWSAVGQGEFLGPVDTLIPWEDAQGRALLVAGDFLRDPNDTQSTGFNRWNGQVWSRLVGGQDTSTEANGVRAFAVVNTGTTRALYLGGQLGVADAGGSLNPRGVVRWDGQRWQPTEQSFDGEIHSITAWDDGKGSSLILAGAFTTGAGQRLYKLAKWDGQQASELGEGIRMADFGRSSLVNAVASFNDGTGSAIYVAGYFATRGALSVTNFARWNGSAWSSVGDLEFVRDPFVVAPNCLAVFNDGTGPALYVAGAIDRIFDASGARFIDPIMSWNGTEWRTFRTLTRNGGGRKNITHLLPVHSGPARGLYFGGDINLQNSGTGRFWDLGVWDGQEFRSPGDFSTVFPANNFFDRTLDRGVESLGVMETPEGTEIYFGAKFRATDTIGLARMRNGRWDRLPALPNGSEFSKDIFNAFAPNFGAMSGFDDGFGPQMYVAAPIHTPDGAGMLDQRSWSRWTGTQWELLGPIVGRQLSSDPVIRNIHRLTSSLLPYDVNGIPALLRGSTPLFNSGTGVSRWMRTTTPCPPTP